MAQVGEDLFPPHHYRSTIEVRCRIVYPRSQKNADLADLGTVMPHVYSQKEEISACVEDFFMNA